MQQQQARLPGGASLTPGESALVGDRFMFSTVAVYLHTELTLTNRRLYAIRPNTILGLIPVGTSRSSFPIESIAGVSAGTKFSVLGVVVGLFAVLFGLGALAIPNAALLRVLLVLLGLASIIGAPKQAIEVMNSGGGTISFPVSVFERGRTVDFANRVSEAMARTPTRGGGVAVAPAGMSEAADPTDSLRRLQELRDKGLVTPAEYAAKRTEILSRL